MKKLFTPLALLGIAGFLFSCSPSKDAVKKRFIDECNKSATAAAGITDDQKKIFEDYCNCSADKVLDKYSVSEIESMEKNQSEMMQKLMPVIQPCMDEMQQKIMGAMQQSLPQDVPATTNDTAVK